MNRKQRRRTKQKVEDEYTQSTKSIIITLVVVAVVFALFYVLTVFINDSSRKLNTKEPEVIVIPLFLSVSLFWIKEDNTAGS